MLLEAISGDADNFDVALLEVLGATSNLTELSGANRSEITWMGEEDGLFENV